MSSRGECRVGFGKCTASSKEVRKSGMDVGLAKSVRILSNLSMLVGSKRLPMCSRGKELEEWVVICCLTWAEIHWNGSGL